MTVPPARGQERDHNGADGGHALRRAGAGEEPEGHSDWSRSGTGSPNPDVANRNPAFSSRSHTFSVAENTPPGTDVGSLVAALDPDGDTLTYTLEGVDADSFDIIATNGAGQIQTKAALNHEEKASYSVAVRARDGRGGTDAVNVTIRVTDVDNEAPDTPFAPTVTALSSTSLQVSWDAPANTGPPITDYDYRYRGTDGLRVDRGHEHDDQGHDGHDRGTDPEHVLRRGGAGEERGGHERMVESGQRSDERTRRQQPARVQRGRERHAERERKRAAGTNIGEPVAATDADRATR